MKNKRYIIACVLIALGCIVADNIYCAVQPTAKGAAMAVVEETQVATMSFEEEEIVIEVPDDSNNRFYGLNITEEDIELMARIVWLESRGEPEEGQQMVAEVILNRVLSDEFPDNVYDVIYQTNQFTTAKNVSIAEPGQAQYEAVDRALYGEQITNERVVFFSTAAYNSHIFAEVGGHVFCELQKAS